jgi:release factor glutamine methyltransferase
MMRREAALASITATLAAAGIENPRREARLLLAAALHTDSTGLLRIETVDEGAYAPLLARRAAHEPLAYISGRREFWGFAFEVSPATLIPRPDSETLIEAALDIFPTRSAVQSILDLGTGTGCLLIAALSEFCAAYGVGVDVCAPAAALARRNAATHRADALFLVGNWADALDQKFDLILANPPYILSTDIKHLMPDVQNYEPASALDGGADGFDAYRAIIGSLARLLAPNGVAILEMGIGQESEILRLAETARLHMTSRADLAGIPRAAILRGPK